MGAKEIIWLDTASSTNSEAFELIEKGCAPQGTVIATLNQIAGRGQGQSLWESQPGKNLAFSMIINPTHIPPAEQFILNQAIALGVREGIEKISKIDTFKIKWPNDIYYNRFKVAGILIENRIIGSVFGDSVVGVGINLNQEKFVSDAPNPSSLKNICGKEFDVIESLQIMVDSVWYWYQELANGQAELIKSRYLKQLLGFGVSRRFIAKNVEFSAKITGIDDYGRLLLQRSGGNTETYDFKEVAFLH